MKPGTLNLIEEKWEAHLNAKYNPSSTYTKRINKWDLLKLKSFCKAKDTVNKTKQQPTEQEKILTNPTSDRSDLQNIQRTQEIGHQKNTQSNRKWSTDVNRELNRGI